MVRDNFPCTGFRGGGGRGEEGEGGEGRGRGLEYAVSVLCKHNIEISRSFAS